MMIKKIYDTFIFRYPFFVLVLVSLFIATLGHYSTKMQIDASAQTLLLEDDEDLKFFREVYQRYGSSNFLIVTFSPKNALLLSDKSLETIKNISSDFEKVENISSVVSILTVPLLQSPVRPISDLIAGVDSMQSKEFDKELVKNEFLTSPLYKNALVSADFKTTAILLNIKENSKYFEFLDKRKYFLEKQKDGTISKEEEKELQNINLEFKKLRDKLREDDTKNIEKIRDIIKNYENEANIFLGGVNMIATDVVGFVKNDLLIYGFSLIIIFIFILWYIFRRARWVFIPLLICFICIISSCGVLGFFNWEVTVISSNFIALQLIITMSIVIHLIERYRELFFKYKRANQYKLVINTVLSKLMPCSLAIITTVVGFASLVLSNIQPVINLGLMMSLGIVISLIISFILFPIILMLIGKKDEFDKSDRKFSFINKCSKIVENNGKTIIVVSAITVIFSLIGASKLFVENSFINYFKKSTEIYKGMIAIDENLGGTTPLDVIIKFKDDEIKENITNTENNDFDDFESEFVLNQDDKQYWFTQDKMQTIMNVHNYLESIHEIGKVQSLATLLKVGKILNNNQDLDGITLALIYNQLPNEYKQLLLAPYINIDANEARVTMRIIDSNPHLRRDDLLKKINSDLENIITNKDTTYRLTNLMVLYNNMLQSLFQSQASTFLASLFVLSLMFFLIFRLSKVVFIAIVSNLIPISLVFGIMGWLGIPLDIMTITIAAIALGIAVDDTIHFIHRFEVEYKFDHNYMNAIKRAHEGIGHAMYYTTIVIVIGFSILMFSNLIPTIYFGLLTGVVMISVLIADLLLLPKMLLMLKPYDKKERNNEFSNLLRFFTWK